MYQRGWKYSIPWITKISTLYILSYNMLCIIEAVMECITEYNTVKYSFRFRFFYQNVSCTHYRMKWIIKERDCTALQRCCRTGIFYPLVFLFLCVCDGRSLCGGSSIPFSNSSVIYTPACFGGRSGIQLTLGSNAFQTVVLNTLSGGNLSCSPITTT